MKSVVLIILIVVFSVLTSYSQADTTLSYFDSEWKEVTYSSYTYYRKVYKTKNRWNVIDYYNNDSIQMTGAYLDKKLKKKDGQFYYFSKDGEVTSQVVFFKGKENDVKIKYYSSSLVRSKERFKKGKLEGGSFWYFENGVIASKEKYKKNKKLSYQFFDEKGNELGGDYPYEVMPEYPGGVNKMVSYISESVVYPESAIDNDIQGRVFVSFVVGKNGEVDDVKSKNYIHKTLNKEAERVVWSFPKWSPGKQHNLKVRVAYAIPINFRLKY